MDGNEDVYGPGSARTEPRTTGMTVFRAITKEPMEVDREKRIRDDSEDEENSAKKASKSEPREKNAVNQREDYEFEEEEDDDIPLIIQLGEKAIKDQITFCKATMTELLRNSPFEGKHTGKPRYMYENIA